MQQAAKASARLEPAADGALRLVGCLGFDTVTAIYREANNHLSGNGRLIVDLAAVERADSAGLALLVEWTRQAAAAGRELRFRNMPEQMLRIARVSGLEAVLPLAANQP